MATNDTSATAPKPQNAPLAPWPHIDRYPTILGSAVTLQYIGSVFRLALTGYRREYVDLLDELLERDPQTFAVISQRILVVAGGRLDFAPPPTTNDAEAARAEEIAERVRVEFSRIPDLQQSLASLLWALYYGVSANEIGWRVDADGWHVGRLFWIHSRRLAYPDPASWSVRIWDQGMVRGWNTIADEPTSQTFGIAAEEFPGKFIVHAPQLRGDYPTRDGLGRELAFWIAIKLMAARGAGEYVERFGKPWAFGTYATSDDGKPRAATEDDVTQLQGVIKAIGSGSLHTATFGDWGKVELAGPGAQTGGRSKLVHSEMIALCDAQIAKATLGQSDTVEAGANGSRSAVETRKDGTRELNRYDAACLADTLQSQLVWWLVHLNFPGEEHLAPVVAIHCDEKPDPQSVIDVAAKAIACGFPVDVDAVAAQIGVPLVAPRAGEKRRGAPLAPMKPIDLQSLARLDEGAELQPPAPPPSQTAGAAHDPEKPGDEPAKD